MVTLNGNSLSLEELVAVARRGAHVELSDDARERVRRSREVIESTIKEREVVYGVNTGFGRLSEVRIADSDIHEVQKNLLFSHACGSGESFPVDVVRAMMVLRINALAKGHSGIREVTIETMVEMLNADLIPVVFEQGSLGASGDLVPLAHMALPLLGEGEVTFEGKRLSSAEGLKRAGVDPLNDLQAKECLALINGTQAMTAVGALTVYDLYKTLYYASLSGALSFEALQGVSDVFDKRIHEARNHEGQLRVASLMQRLLDGSNNTSRQGEVRIQDAYSLRCLPQVHGAVLSALRHVMDVIEKEINAATDNPLIFEENPQALSAGNFHGQPVAMPMDYLAIAATEMSSISERRLERLVNHELNGRFPGFLAKDPGKHSGFMIVQYVAASLVSENKTLSHPASVDSIPSSANQEDHVSMGTIAARKAQKIAAHTRRVVALEMFCAAQAVDFIGNRRLSPISRRTYEVIRKRVPFLEGDAIMKPYMDAIEELLIEGALDDSELEAMLWNER